MFTYFLTSMLIIHLTVTNCTFICYHLIRLYSYLQIKLTTNKPQIKNSNEDMLDCLIGNTLTIFNINDKILEIINESDFAVLVSKGTNMVCFYPPIEQYNPEYEMSILQFISVKVEIDSVEYDIKMRSHNYTFYIVDNALNVDWVRYYFRKFLKISLPEDVKYQMTIIDENVQFIMLNENESMVLEQNSYRLYLEDQIEEEDDDQEEEEEQDDNQEKEEEQDDNQEKEEEQDNDQEEEKEQEPNDPDELSVERMIEIEEEIKAEQQQQQDEGDLDVDKLIDEFERMNLDKQPEPPISVLEHGWFEDHEEKARGWFNLF